MGADNPFEDAPAEAAKGAVKLARASEQEGGLEGSAQAGQMQPLRAEADMKTALGKDPLSELAVPTPEVRCVNCGVDIEKVLRCSKCKLPTYCNRECQKQHWKLTHKRECGQQQV